MAGASLLPDFYNSKINLAILEAPVTSMFYMQNEILIELSTTDSIKFI